AGALAGVAVLTRSIGVVLVPAGLWQLARRADRRRAAGFVAGVVLVTLPWATWLAQHHGAGGDQDYLRQLASDGGVAPATMLQNLVELPAGLALVALPGLPELVGGDLPPGALVLLYGLGLAMLASATRFRFGPALLLACAVAVLVPWALQPRFL